jgi:hypothetical protein
MKVTVMLKCSQDLQSVLSDMKSDRKQAGKGFQVAKRQKKQ